jgi:hypothetical protein
VMVSTLICQGCSCRLRDELLLLAVPAVTGAPLGLLGGLPARASSLQERCWSNTGLQQLPGAWSPSMALTLPLMLHAEPQWHTSCLAVAHCLVNNTLAGGEAEMQAKLSFIKHHTIAHFLVGT